MITQLTWLYFIVDNMNRSYYVDSGVVKKSSPPVPLPQDPKGWLDLGISFSTNQKYWSLNRSFTVPMFFVNDGAQICRELLWSGKGYEEEAYIIILKLNPATGVHELEYKGRLDFSKAVDEPRKGITVPSIEGGVLTYLTANEGVDYELNLSSLNPAAMLIRLDGVNLFDRYRYSLIEVDITKPSDLGHNAVATALPFSFISNDGDSVGIIQGSQTFEEISASTTMSAAITAIGTYAATSANCFFSSINPITVRPSSVLKFTVYPASNPTLLNLYFITSSGNVYNILGVAGTSTQNYSVQTDVSIELSSIVPAINLAANEKLFLTVAVFNNSVSSTHITWHLSDLFFAFDSRNAVSTTYGLPIIDVLKQLVSAMTEGKFTGDSVYFSAHKNLIWTSTNALQNFAFQVYYGSFVMADSGGIYTITIPGALNTLPTDNQLLIAGAPAQNGAYTVLNVGPLIAGFTTITVKEPVTNATLSGTISTVPALKINFQDFFNDVDCLYNIGMKIVNDVIFIEPKGDIYKDDMQILDIGEIAKFKMRYADELLCNTLKIGYKSQDYRQRNGVYEFNTTTLFKLPVNTLKKELTKVLKARADCFGIEFIRSIIFNKPTTDVTGDNQCFVIDTVPAPSETYYKWVKIEYNGGASVHYFVDKGAAGFFDTTSQPLPFATNLLSSQLTFVAAGPANFATYITANYSGWINGIQYPGQMLTIDGSGILTPYLIINRPAYSNITGVLDYTVYNTEITPHKLMLKQGTYLRAILLQLPAGKVVFQTADKNSALSTTLGGVTVAERQDETVSTLGDPLFFPWYAEFTTPVPLSFAKIMAGIGTGYVKGTFYGQPVYFLPIGKMDAKPALNAAQNWKLMLAPNNDLEKLKQLSDEGNFKF